jgi:ABC-2 type transport system ATP-binding protein
VFEARGLTKRYQTLLAVNDVNFTIGPGEILGYLGPNGSGKSTTINMVVGLLEPSSGWTALFGQRLDEHPEDYKRRVGYVPEEPHVYTHLTAIEYLELVGRLRDSPHVSSTKRSRRSSSSSTCGTVDFSRWRDSRRGCARGSCSAPL